MWPNWVDLVIVTYVIRGCYVGFDRGLLAELLHALGLIAATSVACNFHEWVAKQALQWWFFDSSWLYFWCFWGLLLGTFLIVRLVLRRLLELFASKGPQVVSRAGGGLIGAARGGWWGGLTLALFLSLNLPYLSDSIQDRSIFAPQFLSIIHRSVRWSADIAPGHDRRRQLVPAVKLTIVLPRLPSINDKDMWNTPGTRTIQR